MQMQGAEASASLNMDVILRLGHSHPVSFPLRLCYMVGLCICVPAAAHSQSSCAQVRAMPNAPCVIRQAATAFVLGTHAVEKDAQKTIMLMSSVGEPQTAP